MIAELAKTNSQHNNQEESRIPAINKIEDRMQAPNDFQDKIQELIKTAGTVELTTGQKDILFRPVNENDVEIRPDGLIYLPWMEYVTRLKNAFGLKWSIIPCGMPKQSGNLIIWGFYLVLDGRLAGFAIGEQSYQPTNKTMSYGDACEGAKSNCLMRLCKGLGICLELWKPSFVTAWKRKYAESYYDKKKSKTLWRKKAVNNQEDIGMGDTTGNTDEITSLNGSGGNRHVEPLTSRELVDTLTAVKNVDELRELWDKHHKDYLIYSDNVKKELIQIKDKIKASLMRDTTSIVGYDDILAFQSELGTRRFIEVVQPFQPVNELGNDKMFELKGKLNYALDVLNNGPVKC